MALLTDDMDINTSYFRIQYEENGDYYPTITWKDENGMYQSICTRIAISGGLAPTSVKLALVDLFRELETNGLNEYPE